MENYLIRADKLKKIYKLPGEEIVALKGINFSIKQGEFVSIVGPSGAGKTTLLNLIGCLDSASSGSLTVLGKELLGLKERNFPVLRRKNIGFVFEEFFLISSLTAFENVELARHFARLSFQSGKTKDFLAKVGLTQRMNHLPRELSGGEMQRVAIARAIATSPKILLADEPTGNLDTKNAQIIFNIFRQLKEKEGITVVIATHNRKLAYQADRSLHLVDGNIVNEEAN